MVPCFARDQISWCSWEVYQPILRVLVNVLYNLYKNITEKTNSFWLNNRKGGGMGSGHHCREIFTILINFPSNIIFNKQWTTMSQFEYILVQNVGGSLNIWSPSPFQGRILHSTKDKGDFIFIQNFTLLLLIVRNHVKNNFFSYSHAVPKQLPLTSNSGYQKVSISQQQINTFIIDHYILDLDI